MSGYSPLKRRSFQDVVNEKLLNANRIELRCISMKDCVIAAELLNADRINLRCKFLENCVITA